MNDLTPKQAVRFDAFTAKLSEFERHSRRACVHVPGADIDREQSRADLIRMYRDALVREEKTTE